MLSMSLKNPWEEIILTPGMIFISIILDVDRHFFLLGYLTDLGHQSGDQGGN